MVWSGDSEVIGSWKIMAMRPPRRACMTSLSGARDAMSTVFPLDGSLKRIDPFVDPGLVRQDLEDGLRGHRLARAGLADERHRFPFGDIECQSVDGTEISGIGAEIDRQLANRQEWRFHMLLQAYEHNALDPIRSQM